MTPDRAYVNGLRARTPVGRAVWRAVETIACRPADFPPYPPTPARDGRRGRYLGSGARRPADARCVHCRRPAETGTADELGAPFCETCADAAVYGVNCGACGAVPNSRRCPAGD